MGLAVWTQDEAGPFQTVPFAGHSWQEDGRALRQPHEYVRDGTAKLLTLFHPGSGEVRARGVTSCPNVVLHAWLKAELTQVLARLPCAPTLDREANRAAWESWQADLQWPIALSAELPGLRMLLVLDNLTGHKTPELVLWMFANGIMPLYTPLSGSWLNMCESERAHHQAAGVGMSASAHDRRDHQLAGSDSAWLESRADGVRVGRRASGKTCAEPTTKTCSGRLRCLGEASASAATNDHTEMATSMSNDPLVCLFHQMTRLL